VSVFGSGDRDAAESLEALQEQERDKDFQREVWQHVEAIGAHRCTEDLRLLWNHVKEVTKGSPLWVKQTNTRLLGVFAEFERSIIQERIKAGLSRARANGKRLGRPRGSSRKRDRMRSTVRRLRNKGKPIRTIAKEVGIAPNTVQSILRES
jgi:hypothetical protein